MMMGSRLRGVLLERVVAYDHELTMMIMMMMMLKARGFGNFLLPAQPPGPSTSVPPLMHELMAERHAVRRPRGGRRRPLYAAVRLVHELTMMMMMMMMMTMMMIMYVAVMLLAR